MNLKSLEVIGIDHGWSMMKTVSQVFITGAREIKTEPAVYDDVLELDGKYYKIGTQRQEVKDTKTEDESFLILTYAAIAKELRRRGKTDADVFLAVGLPLTRFGNEKADFVKYLTERKEVSFCYEGTLYSIRITNAAVFPQCYAAVADRIVGFKKKTVIVDIGSWTIDIMPVINKSPDESNCITIPKGLITCMRSINEKCVRLFNGEIDETELQNMMRYGKEYAKDEEYYEVAREEIEAFAERVYNSIREYGYNLKTTPIIFVGGGAVVMKNYGGYDQKNIDYILDIKANARGYEQLADIGLRHMQKKAQVTDVGKENLVCSTLRLNMNNQQHVKINQILCSIDKDVCKSKNQFIIDAIEFYIEYYGKDVLVREEKDIKYVTADEIESIKQDLMNAAMTEARNEVIRLLGTAVAGRGLIQAIPYAQETEIQQESEEQIDDEVVSGLATGWMTQEMQIGGKYNGQKIFCWIRQFVTCNIKRNPLGTIEYIEACTCTGKNLPFTVWADCQIIPGICQSRYTIRAVRGGELMIRYFAAYKKNRRLMKYFFGLKKFMV